MDKKKLSKIINKMQDSEWLFYSGFAVEVYTQGKRKAGDDLDVMISQSDIDKVAKRFNTRPDYRKFNKADFVVEDYAFQTSFQGLTIEATSGFPKNRLKNGTMKRVFENKVKKTYMGLDLYVQPIEDLIILKAYMGRPKDIRDLNLLKDKKYNKKMIHTFTKDWQVDDDRLDNLKMLK
jgi:hypothetical protein